MLKDISQISLTVSSPAIKKHYINLIVQPLVT